MLALLALLAPGKVAAAPSEQGWSAVRAADLGLDSYIRRKWRSPTLTLRHQTRVDRLITAARLHLAFAAPPSGSDVLGRSVKVNGVEVAKLERSELLPSEGSRDIPIEGRLLTARNDISLTLIRPASAAACVPAGTWSILAPDSRLEALEQALPSEPTLAA